MTWVYSYNKILQNNKNRGNINKRTWMSIIDIILRESQRSVFHSLKVPAPENLGVEIESDY